MTHIFKEFIIINNILIIPQKVIHSDGTENNILTQRKILEKGENEQLNMETIENESPPSHGLLYGVDDEPPWYLTFALGFQVMRAKLKSITIFF